MVETLTLNLRSESIDGEPGWPRQEHERPYSGFRELSTRGMTVELWLILIYLVATGIADLQASKLGLMLGPIPIFFTDITLFLLLVASFLRRPSRILYWMSEGVGAGSVGRTVWLIIVLAVVLFCLAVGEYPLFAARDLAIFSYSLFYPLVYFAIRDRPDASRLVRYFTYAGVIAAALLLLQQTIGLDLGLFDEGKRVALGHTFIAIRSGNGNAFTIFAFVSIWAYVIFEPKLRTFHAACAILCFYSLAASDSRAGVVGVFCAAAITLWCAGTKQRVVFLLVIAFVAFPVIFAPMIPTNMPASKELQGLRLSVMSAAGGPSVDGNAKFRTLRWKSAISLWSEHPWFGIGFGRQIIPRGLVDGTEASGGQFNVGMPHNTFLFLGARSGIVGLLLVLYCWCSVVYHLCAKFRRTRRVQDLAVANILAAMFGSAMFGLFLERPGTDASFWILAAIGTRLVDYQQISAMIF